MDSCTRDTYIDGTSFAIATILQIAIGIASAAAHLHTQGIMHGDLYAHNIMTNDRGDCLLGDFGAASSYDRTDRITGNSLERLEVRAFGCLLEDLLERCQLPDTKTEKWAMYRLEKLSQDCLYPLPIKRPLFVEIGRFLSEITMTA